MVTFSRYDDVVVEQPERMSVSELKSWLSQFAEKNRTHYEKNQVKTSSSNLRSKANKFDSSSNLRTKTNKFEDQSISLSSSGSTSVASPPQLSKKLMPLFQHEEAEKTQRMTTPRVDAKEDALPKVDERDYEIKAKHTKERCLTEELDNFRIVSIQKLHDPDLTQLQSNSVCWDDDFSDPWADPSQGVKQMETKLLWSSANETHFMNSDRYTYSGDYLYNVVEDEDNRSVSKSRSDRRNSLILTSSKDKGALQAQSMVSNVKKGYDTGDYIPIISGVMRESLEGYWISPSPLFKEQSFTKVATHLLAAPSGNNIIAESLDYPIPKVLAMKDNTDYNTVSSWDDDDSVVAFPESSREFSNTVTIGEVFSEALLLGDEEQSISRSMSTQHAIYPPDQANASQPEPSVLTTTLNGTGGNQRDGAIYTDDTPLVKPSDVSARWGRNRKQSAVQRRQLELEAKWAKDRPTNVSRKVQWHVSKGCYKKKVVLDYGKGKDNREP